MSYHDSDETQLLRKSVASIAGKYGAGYFLKAARDKTGTDDLWSDLAAAGYIGVNTPEAYGGGGGGMRELAAVAEETAAAGTPLVLLMVSPAICATILATHGTGQQREQWLPRLTDGTAKIAFALTEPDAGSNTHAITTTASAADGGWTLEGTKYYISGADEADAFLVVARTRDDAGQDAGTSLFLVPADSPGVGIRRIAMEITAPENQYFVTFDGVRLDEAALVGQVGRGMRSVFTGLNPERIVCAAIAVGLGRYALAKAAAYARTRTVFGVPIGSHQGLAHPLALAHVHVELAAVMTAKAAWEFDNGHDAAASSNAAKLAAADAALEALDAAVQTLGGNGLSQEYELAAYWGLARLFKIAPVSREMVLNHVARHSLDLPKSY